MDFCLLLAVIDDRGIVVDVLVDAHTRAVLLLDVHQTSSSHGSHHQQIEIQIPSSKTSKSKSSIRKPILREDLRSEQILVREDLGPRSSLTRISCSFLQPFFS